MQRPFRFGVNTTGIESRAAWQDRARRLEDDGWSTLLVPDHLGGVSTLAPLVSAADATSALRVGSLVVNNDLFHPMRRTSSASPALRGQAPRWPRRERATTPWPKE